MGRFTAKLLIEFGMVALLGAPFAGADTAGGQTFQPSPALREIQALRLEEKPVIDGQIVQRDKPGWTPVIAVDWPERNASVAAWFRPEWNDEDFYVAVFLPGASTKKSMPAAPTLKAPFVVEMDLDVQPEPIPGGGGRYRLKLAPLSKSPTRMDLRSETGLATRRLGAGTKPGDPGVVLCGESTHAGFPLDETRARWSEAPGGLAFEATIAWRSLGLEGPPTETPFLFDLAVARPGMGRRGWIAGAHGDERTGGAVRLLDSAEAFDPEAFARYTLTPVVSSPLNLQQEAIQAAFPLCALMGGPNEESPAEFVLIGPDGLEKASATSEAGPVAMASLETDGLPDGLYRLQARRADNTVAVAERSIRLAGQFVKSDLRPRRARLEERLEKAKSRKQKSGDRHAFKPPKASQSPFFWRDGHVERARACVKASILPAGATPGDLEDALRSLDDARAILDALDAGRRPDPKSESVDHGAGFAADGTRGPVEFVPVAGDRARLVVEAADETPWQVSPFIYGTFSEPLAYGWPIYRNLHAQLVVNPSFAWGSPKPLALITPFAGFDAESVREILAGKWRPLIDASEDEVANPWLALGQGNAAFSLVGGAYNTERCVRIEASASARGVGVGQALSLPAWRCDRYLLRCFLRCEGKAPAVTALLMHKGETIDSARFDSLDGQWLAFEAEFKTPLLEERTNTFLLALVFDGPATVFVDQVTLTPSDAVDGFDPQVVEGLREMKPGWIRWPGGNYTSAHNWRDGIGPLDKRPTRLNPAWKGLDPNHLGTDEYLRLCQLADLEPFICVNGGAGSPEEAADWVEYCNGGPETPMGRLRARNGHEAPYGVRYWNIGNELWGHWQIGHCEALENAERYEAFARAMRQRDPSIRLVACGLGPLGGENGRRWNEALFDRLGSEIECLDFHTYVRLDGRRDLDALDRIEAYAAMPATFEQALMEFRDLCLERGLDRTRIVQGEYNSRRLKDAPPRLNLVGDLLAYAGWLHVFMRQGDYVIGANATEFSPFNPRAIQFGQLHPRCELFALYAARAGSQPVHARLETPVRHEPRRLNPILSPVFNLPLVDAVALKDPADGSLALSFINRDFRREIAVDIELKDFDPAPRATRFRHWDNFPLDQPKGPFTRPSFEEEEFHASERFALPLPPHSVTLLKIPERRQD
jgi:hypothetical protein